MPPKRRAKARPGVRNTASPILVAVCRSPNPVQLTKKVSTSSRSESVILKSLDGSDVYPHHESHGHTGPSWRVQPWLDNGLQTNCGARSSRFFPHVAHDRREDDHRSQIGAVSSGPSSFFELAVRGMQSPPSLEREAGRPAGDASKGGAKRICGRRSGRRC